MKLKLTFAVVSSHVTSRLVFALLGPPAWGFPTSWLLDRRVLLPLPPLLDLKTTLHSIFSRRTNRTLHYNSTHETYTMPAPKMSLGDELARLSLQEPLPIIPGDQKQLRKRLIRERINLLERARAHLQPHEKWPTTRAVQAYREELAQSKSTGGLDCSSDVDPSPLKRQPNHDPSHFPFPVLGVKERATRFMPFQRLPIEIRHIIWRIAAEHPRFIEIQDFKKAKPDVIVKAIGDHVLEAVCTESREIALQGRTRRSAKT